MTDSPWRIPLSDVDLGAEEEGAVLRVIRSGWLTSGQEVAEFEREFEHFCQGGHAVALSNCTAALHLACVALGVEPGVEVVVPTMTFVATANAVVLAGGRPVFADCAGNEDLTLDPEDVERRITERTAGVICVHYGGYACQMERLAEICRARGLFLIEDVAHAPGAMWGGRRLGTWGDVGCFSFFGNKNMTTGEGGIALAREQQVADRIRALRSHGMSASSWDKFKGHAYDYDVGSPGFNYRLAELPAAVGREQLRKLAANNERRRELVSRYRERLTGVPGVSMPFASREDGVAHLAVVLLDEAQARDRLREQLREARIQTSLHYPPVHLFAHYRSQLGCRPGDLPLAEDLSTRVLTMPLYPTMTPELVDEVCDRIRTFASAG